MDPRCPPTKPLDPDSPEGRVVAERMASTLAELAARVQQRKRTTQTAEQSTSAA
jgi:hypothetical protein